VTVPATAEEAVSVQWLSHALDLDIRQVWVGRIDDRVSSNVPISIELGNGSRSDYWIKGYFTELGQAFRQAGIPEAMFYRELAESSRLRTLRPVYTEVDVESSANVVITEDVRRAGAEFLDARNPYHPEQVAESLSQLALLHADTWLQPVGQSPWLTPRLTSYTLARGVKDIASNFEGPIGAGVPEDVRDARKLFEAFEQVARGASDATPWCVIHGDPHIGNMFLDGDGRPCFLDWQLVQRGPWYLDVGYHVAAALNVEDRRRTETALVEHYLSELATHGIEAPPLQEAWSGVRRGFIHGFYLWGITQRVDPEITARLLERLGTAVADHIAYEGV
jgi:hypothetical protein